MNGKNIAKYREDNGISQFELAKKLNIAKSTLSRWENNKTVPMGGDYDRLISIIGEKYNTDQDLTEKKTAVEVIGEVSDRVDNILYQVSEIESNQRFIDVEKSELRHRRIRTTVVIITCITVLALAIGTWFYIMNYGFKGEVVEGPAEMGTPSFLE